MSDRQEARSDATTASPDPATERPIPPGWDESHLDAYRDGYTDALLWALERDHHEIEAVLDDPE